MNIIKEMPVEIRKKELTDFQKMIKIQLYSKRILISLQNATQSNGA